MTLVFRFLSSVYFALILIFLTILLAAIGTLLESVSGSHLYAAEFAYQHPVFQILFWGFFINILFSALRRFPFKKKHIPFLMTHLGLLCVLGGALMKSYFGTQGSLSILEGSGSDDLFLQNTYAIRLEKQRSSLNKGPVAYVPMPSPPIKGILKNTNFPYLEIECLDFSPHSLERQVSWIKDGRLNVDGIKQTTLSSYETSDAENSLLIASDVTFEIKAFKTLDPQSLIEELYLKSLTAVVKNSYTEEVLLEMPLKDLLADGARPFDLKAFLDLDFSPSKGIQSPKLSFEFIPEGSLKKEAVSIDLSGPQSLLNHRAISPFLGKAPLALDLKRPPALFFVQDAEDSIFLIACGPFGEIASTVYLQHPLKSLLAYEKGFGGYSLEALPFSSLALLSRQEKEKALLNRLTSLLKEHPREKTLLPPFEFLKKASETQDADFADICTKMLKACFDGSEWLFSENRTLSKEIETFFEKIDQNLLSPQEKKACMFTSAAFSFIEEELREGKSLLPILKGKKWPLFKKLEAACDENDEEAAFALFTKQLFFSANDLPLPDENTRIPPAQFLRLLSAYLRAYDLHLFNLLSAFSEKEMGHIFNLYKKIPAKDVCIECPLSFAYEPRKPLIKREDNLPCITLKLTTPSQTETVCLGYDRYGKGIKTPVLNGSYLAGFQPLFKKIPYRVRLKSARQINYPGTSQPYSFESEIAITDSKTGKKTEALISMNHVYETWDGYRFYLAGISPSDQASVKRVQIVVNHDPAKYILTYPGAFLVAAGIVLLFWMKPYSKKKSP